MELSEAKRVLNEWNRIETITIKDPDILDKKAYIERKEAIDTVLQALEELQKENEGIKARVDKYLQGGSETLRLEHEETLKYYHENYISKDKIKEKIEEQTKRIDKLLEDMIDKSTGCINVSYLSKKEKEEIIAKRNSLLVQRATLQQVKEELLKGE